MKNIAYLLVLLSMNVMANECKISSELLSAYYKVSHNNSGANNENIQLLELHRNKNRILKRNISQGVHNSWTVNGNRYSLTRSFDKYQHAIEYQANELNYQPQQQDIHQIVSTPSISKMQLVKQNSSGCDLVQHYILADQKNRYELAWLPKLALIKSFKIISNDASKEWSLTHYERDEYKITSLLSVYDNYQSTDYADIGDNESIPFLAAMIQQGFSTKQNVHTPHTEHDHDH